MSERQTFSENYESFWERRYEEQHRTLHAMEDEIAALRAQLTHGRERAVEVVFQQLMDADLDRDLRPLAERIVDLLAAFEAAEGDRR